MDSYMRNRTALRYFVLFFCIICAISVSAAYAGCGIDTNPYDDDPGPLPNGYFPPDPDFSGDPVQGYAPLAVSFSDRSTNSPLYWSWSFGDGQSSSEKNPVHRYESPGRYSVSLIAGNRYGGNSITKVDYVVVNPVSSSPVVDFSANITTGDAPLQVEFTDLTTGGLVLSRVWTFSNDGIQESVSTSSQKIVHSFLKPGQYNISLIANVENNKNGYLEKSYYISVNQPVPVQGTVTIYPGWNLISTPLALKEQYRTAGQVFSQIDTDSRSIYTYDAGLKQFIPMNSDSVISPLEGIWVYSKNEVQLSFIYDVTRPLTISMHLPPGWNLIGYPSTDPGNAREGFVTIGNTWSTILCFDPVTQQYSSTIFNEGVGGQSDMVLMHPMKGYWLYMPHEGNLEISII
jgi:PKD repeat protein